MNQTKISVDLRSFVAQVEQLIRLGEIELLTPNEIKAHKITRVRFNEERGIQVTIGHLYRSGFIPNADMKKKELFDEIIYEFRELSAKLDTDNLSEQNQLVSNASSR